MDKCMDFILDYLEQRGVDLNSDEIDSSHLVEDGFLDSFGILALFMAVEDEYSIKILPEDMLNESNATVKGLVKLIKSRRE